MADRALFHPESVELVPGRKKLERQPHQLRRGDREKVCRGKELHRWQYSASEWERHIIACSRRLIDPDELSSALVDGAMDVVMYGEHTPLQRNARKVRAEFALATSLDPARDDRTALRRELEAPLQPARGEEWVWAQLQTVVQPEEVLVTSTGILFGELARVWGGRSCRFFSAETEGEDPTYLVFEFQKRWLFWWLGKTSLWVPLPRDRDADALLELIEPWLSTR